MNGFGLLDESETVEREFDWSIPAAISDPEAVRIFGGKRSCLPILQRFSDGSGYLLLFQGAIQF
jgi:hypothetical protein